MRDTPIWEASAAMSFAARLKVLVELVSHGDVVAGFESIICSVVRDKNNSLEAKILRRISSAVSHHVQGNHP